MAVALLAPAADAALADATEPAPEQENEYEGGNETESQDGAGEGAGDLTPGQDSTGSLQDEDSPPLNAPGDPVNPEEGESGDGPVETEVNGEPVATPAPAPPPPPTSPAPAPPVQEGPAPSQVAPLPVPAPRSGVAPVRRPAKPAAERKQTEPRRRPSKRRARQAPAMPQSPGTSPPPAASQAPSVAVRAAAATPERPGPAGATYKVKSGDTLWSIASARLGGDATPAQIAREVQRIWKLNAHAIGTGDPSLIGVGVELRLR